MQKICPNCEMPFDTAYVQKEYCTDRCRRSAKLKRVHERDSQKDIVQAGNGEHELVKSGATAVELSAFALQLTLGLRKDPGYFGPPFVDWTPPSRVLWDWTNAEHLERCMRLEGEDTPMVVEMRKIREEFNKQQAEKATTESPTMRGVQSEREDEGDED